MRVAPLLLFALLLLACAPAAVPGQPRADSVVVMLGRQGPPPCLGLPEEPCRYADRFVPTCAAFAVVHYEQAMLATAAHCIPGAATSTTDLRFWAPNGWGHGHAGLVERNDGADVAFLGVTEPGMLEPLRSGPMPVIGETVHSYSPVFRASSSGRVSAWLGGGWFETTQTAVAGWSGSPVFNERGEVLGLVSKCPSPDGLARGCMPGRVVVATRGIQQ